jgi:hypothetical protein
MMQSACVRAWAPTYEEIGQDMESLSKGYAAIWAGHLDSLSASGARQAVFASPCCISSPSRSGEVRGFLV